MRLVRGSVWWSGVIVATSGLTVACAPSSVKLPPPPPSPFPPEAATEPSDGVSAEKLPPVDGDDGTLVYGYLGKRPVIGRVSPKESRWSATFRFLGVREPFSMAGPVTPREREDEEPPSYDGSVRHEYLDCTLDVGGAGVNGSLSALCLEEGTILEVSGSFEAALPKNQKGYSESVPFFARTPERPIPEQERYYAALAATPAPGRRCAPFVEVIQATPRPSGRSAVLYTMRYPCEEVVTSEMYYRQQAPPVTREAHVAEVVESEPPKVISSTAWTPLGDPDDSNELHFQLNPVEVVPGIELYVATLWDRFQSPVTSAGGSTITTVVWAVGADGRYGKTLTLPSMQNGHAGICHSVTSARELYLTDLDGDQRPELIARTITDSTGQGKPGKDGYASCVPLPEEVKLDVYALDPAALTWVPRQPPKRLGVQLASGRRIQAF